MTYLEKLFELKPDINPEAFFIGSYGCPHEFNLEKPFNCIATSLSCKECWNRNYIEEESPKSDNYDFVEHPLHYNRPGEKETWEKMCDIWGPEKMATWCMQTAFKYADRIGDKPGEDVKREADKIKAYIAKAEEFSNRAKFSTELDSSDED